MYGYSNNNIIELYKSNDTGLTKQHVLEMRNGNSIQKDENKYTEDFSISCIILVQVLQVRI